MFYAVLIRKQRVTDALCLPNMSQCIIHKVNVVYSSVTFVDMDPLDHYIRFQLDKYQRLPGHNGTDVFLQDVERVGQR
jgi:hypothetical protein